MVVVQHFLRVANIVIILRIFVPRKVKQSIQIVLLRGVFRRMRRHPTQLLQLAFKSLLHLLAPFFLLRPFLHGVGYLLVRVTQLLLNGLHLTVQIVFALLFVYILTCLVLDGSLHLKHLQLGVQQFQ